MKLISWNIQWCRGCDGVVDPARIVRAARAMGDFDVLCLQEVARNFPGLAGSAGEDQFRLLSELLPGFTAVEGLSTDKLADDGTRRQFGNFILSRLPVMQVFRHLLPWPADASVPSMQRAAIETIIDAPGGPVRVTTTHLEYYSKHQRAAQVDALRNLQAEAAAHAADPDVHEKKGGPFERPPRPSSGILTADFNLRPEHELYDRLQAPIEGSPCYIDSWRVRHPNTTHAPTLGLFDKRQWPELPFACDFIFVTEDLAPRVVDVVVNGQTDASDHQPVMITLTDELS